MRKFIIQMISLVLVTGIAGKVAAVSETECNAAISDIDAHLPFLFRVGQEDFNPLFVAWFFPLAVLLFKHLDWIVVRFPIQFLLSFDAAVGIEIEDVSITQYPRVLLRSKFSIQLVPQLRLDFRILGLGGQVLNAVRIVENIKELFFRSLAKTQFKESVVSVFLRQIGQKLLGRRGIAVLEPELGIPAGPAIGFKVSNVKKLIRSNRT